MVIKDIIKQLEELQKRHGELAEVAGIVDVKRSELRIVNNKVPLRCLLTNGISFVFKGLSLTEDGLNVVHKTHDIHTAHVFDSVDDAAKFRWSNQKDIGNYNIVPLNEFRFENTFFEDDKDDSASASACKFTFISDFSGWRYAIARMINSRRGYVSTCYDVHEAFKGADIYDGLDIEFDHERDGNYFYFKCLEDVNKFTDRLMEKLWIW